MNALATARATAERLAAGDERELARMLDSLEICTGCGNDLALISADGEQLCVGCTQELDRMIDHALRVRCAYCTREAKHEHIALAIPVCDQHEVDSEYAANALRFLGRSWSRGLQRVR